jgi:hypothetical protein
MRTQRYTLENELDLVFIVVYQKLFQLMWLDEFLQMVHISISSLVKFVKFYNFIVFSSCLCLFLDFSFNSLCTLYKLSLCLIYIYIPFSALFDIVPSLFALLCFVFFVHWICALYELLFLPDVYLLPDVSSSHTRSRSNFSPCSRMS